MHVYIRAGLKSHGPGQHDYPQYLADWSKILTDRGAIVDGSLHFPTAGEIANTDVMVMYKGDAGGMTPEEKATLEAFMRRGGGLVSFHDTLCGPDPDYYSTVVGGACANLGNARGSADFGNRDVTSSTIVVYDTTAPGVPLTTEI